MTKTPISCRYAKVRAVCSVNLPQYKTKGKRKKKKKETNGSQNAMIPFSSSNQVWRACVGIALTKASIGSYDIHEKILDILAEASKKSRRNKMSAEELGKAVDKVLIATKKNAQGAAKEERSERKLHVGMRAVTTGSDGGEASREQRNHRVGASQTWRWFSIAIHHGRSSNKIF